jgi:hypothetical protein
MAGLQPSLQPFGRQRNGIRPGNANDVEAERLGAFDEGLLEGTVF